MAKQRLILRSSTEADWLAANPPLAEYELVYVSDKQDYKVGDGFTPFAGLAYLASAHVVFRGLFVPGAYYLAGQYVEGADGAPYRALRNMYATSQPANGFNWKKLPWQGSSSGGGVPLEGSTITRWEEKVYDGDLMVVLFENNLYYVSDETARPFLSENFIDEYDLGLWTLIGGGGAGNGEPIDTTLLLLSEDGRKITDENGQPITVD